MDWKEKIEYGMQIIKEGCSENTEWSECNNCPFCELCDDIADQNNYNPFEFRPSKWDI